MVSVEYFWLDKINFLVLKYEFCVCQTVLDLFIHIHQNKLDKVVSLGQAAGRRSYLKEFFVLLLSCLPQHED